MMGLTEQDWRDLERNAETMTGDEIFELTHREYEHPEWYECACFCESCMSYADPETQVGD